jgi:hypothetical protein
MTFFGTWLRLAAILALVAIALSPLAARAGAQIEEQLAPSVATVLSAAISDRPVPSDYGWRPEIRPTDARARIFSPPSTTSRCAPGSTRSSCSA